MRRKRGWTIGRMVGCAASILWTWSLLGSCATTDEPRPVSVRDVEAWTRAVESSGDHIRLRTTEPSDSSASNHRGPQ